MPQRKVLAAVAAGALVVGVGVFVVVASRGSSDDSTSDAAATTSTIDPRAAAFPADGRSVLVLGSTRQVARCWRSGGG